MTLDRHRAGRRAAATVVAAALIVGGLVAEAAADPVYPSQEQVDGARQAVDGKAGEIGAIESQLAAASASLDTSQVAAQNAAEDFNQAQVELDARTAAAQQARVAADQARAQVEDARIEIGRLAATSYRTGGGLGGLELFLSANGPADLLDRASALDNIGNHRQRTYQRMDASQTVAALLDEQAQKAQAAQQQAAAAAEQARAEAQRAADAAQAQVDQVAATRATLIGQLATLRQTSVALEQERQDGLEAERQARAEAAARAAAAQREAARQAANRQAADRAAREAADREAAERASRDRQDSSTGQPGAGQGTTPPPPPPVKQEPPTSGGSQGSSSEGQVAVNWARTQIGKMYEGGSAGPDTYDCSGLTMRAWQKAGVSLARTSRDQYRQVAKIAYSQLRPGDLVFYGDGSDAGSIHHVAIYSGGGRMIEAARSGVPVREVSLRMAGAMDYAGRP